jgi:hypothetical protein
MMSWKSVSLALCIVAAVPSLGQTQEQLARGGGGGVDQSNKDTKTTTPTENVTAPATLSGSTVISQLDDAKRRVNALNAQTAALRKEVAGAVTEIRQHKGDPSVQDAAYSRMFGAVRSAQSEIDSNLHAIIQIGRALLASAGR